MLYHSGVCMEAKPFAAGFRIEHLQEKINTAQFGLQGPAVMQSLGPASYKLVSHLKSGRSVYTFCMCPGGEVINAASAPAALVVNGMSRAARNGACSNSALVVATRPADWGAGDVLGGMVFQEELERAAFRAGGGNFRAPAQNLLTFAGRGRGPCRSTCRPGVTEAELAALLPEFVTLGLRRALPHFDRQLRGFLSSEAVLVGVETRTSAPLRIVRNQHGESLSHAGLFPAGEGAGYAGGIMSAALDGLRAAEQILQRLNDGSPL
jgi:hypothetical protein